MKKAIVPIFWLLLAITVNPCFGQVKPDKINTTLLNKSIKAVLGTGQPPEWKVIPLSDSLKDVVEPKMKSSNHLPDSLYVGVLKTEKGNRFVIPDIAPSKSEVFSFALYLDDHHQIIDVDILEYRENRGNEIDYPMFRQQFRGKDESSDVIFGRTIQNISGATISARSLTYAVHDLLAIVQQIDLKTFL